MTDTTPKPPKATRKARTKVSSVAPNHPSVRNQRQAEYQRAYRAEQKRKRIPSRDDVARVALHWFITLNIENDNEAGLSHIHREVVRRLVEHGFDANGADRRVSDLIDRYEAGWDFQVKTHLRVQSKNTASS